MTFERWKYACAYVMTPFHSSDLHCFFSNNSNHSKQWMITKGFFWSNQKSSFIRYLLEHPIEPTGTWISQVIDLIFWINIRAADWSLDQPSWTGRLRLVAKGKDCIIKLEDKITGELFAKSPIDKYPGLAVESVSDSSRYFVIRLQDDSGRNAFIGIGFADRSDSFDLNVALQDHFK